MTELPALDQVLLSLAQIRQACDAQGCAVTGGLLLLLRSLQEEPRIIQ